jgi:hypothetical protein
MIKKSLLAFILILLVFTSACSKNKDDKEQARTYYDTLDLSTPEESVKTFTDAFQKEDFMTVYMILDQSSQMNLVQKLRQWRYRELVRFEDGDDLEEVFEDVSCIAEGLGSGEHSCGDMWYIFDEMMVSAKEKGILLIDLSGDVEIIDTENSETHVGDDAVDVIAKVEGIEDEVVFRMVESKEGRWRVFQVIVAGGDEEIIPWSVPN